MKLIPGNYTVKTARRKTGVWGEVWNGEFNVDGVGPFLSAREARAAAQPIADRRNSKPNCKD